VPVTIYTPGKTYRVFIDGTSQGTTRPRFGFQVSCVKASDSSTQAGSFSTGGYTTIAVRGGVLKLVEHTSPIAGALVSGNYIYTISFNWTAPAVGFGKVRFYAALNAVNFNGNSSGDAPNITTAEYDAAPTGVENIGNQQVATLYPNPVSNVLHLHTKGNAGSPQVMDLRGQSIVLPTSVMSQNETSVDVSRLSAGYYHVVMLVDGNIYRLPFVKN
jgi:hypothetical protein